jgi:hypothetical protein
MLPALVSITTRAAAAVVAVRRQRGGEGLPVAHLVLQGDDAEDGKGGPALPLARVADEAGQAKSPAAGCTCQGARPCRVLLLLAPRRLRSWAASTLCRSACNTPS